VNLAMSSHRRRCAEQRMLRRLQGRDRNSVPEPDAAAAEAIRLAFQELPMELRTVIVLRFYADASVADTAAALGIPEGTVKARTRRALAVLRDRGLIDTTEVIDAP
jgi:RNA polymerase sigma-70 factor, ECF subfamily